MMQKQSVTKQIKFEEDTWTVRLQRVAVATHALTHARTCRFECSTTRVATYSRDTADDRRAHVYSQVVLSRAEKKNKAVASKVCACGDCAGAGKAVTVGGAASERSGAGGTATN